MIQLFKQIITSNNDLDKNVVILKLTYKKEKSTSYSNEITNSKRLRYFTVKTKQETLQLVFLKQSLTANQIRKTPNIFLTISDEKFISLFFTQNEVTFFLSEVNDRNPIHHSKNTVIPACLIFERIVPLLPQDTSEISLHFVHPLYLGECQFIIRKREIALFQNNILCVKGKYR